MYRLQRIMVLLLLVFAVVCAHSGKLSAQTTPSPAPVEHLVPKVLSKKPHNVTSFTEGLVWDNGVFYESSGLYGSSALRKVDIETGNILQETRMGDKFFGEGLALVNNQLVQLTWNEHIAFIYEKDSFNVLRGFIYDGEGWGLCFDGSQIYMSNGSNLITARDPVSFQPTRQMAITLNDQPVVNLNELECVGDSLYVNIWQTNYIYRLDKETGRVTAVIDAAGLITSDEFQKAGPDGVLNGIAYNPDTQNFYITGKLWPWLFEVKFVSPDF